MWNNNGSSQDHAPRRNSSAHSRADDTSSPEYAAAAALARRMVYPAAYESQLPPAGPYYDQDPVWHRQREMELLRLQQMQEAEYHEERARRERLLELEFSVNRMQEYERARMQIEMARDMQHREAMEDRRRMSFAGMDNEARQQQIAEYLAGQRCRAVEEDAEAWRTSSHSQRRSSPGSLPQEDYLNGSIREASATIGNDLKMRSKSWEKNNLSASPEGKKRKHSENIDAGADELKTKADSPTKKAPNSPKKKSSSPKKAKATDKHASPAKTSGSDNATKDSTAKAEYPAPPKSKSKSNDYSSEENKPATPDGPSPNKSPDTETQSPTVTKIVPIEKHASKTLAHLKTIQESREKESTPSKASKKRKKTPKKMDSLASLPDKPAAKGGSGKKKSPAAAKSKVTPKTTHQLALKRNPAVPTIDDPAPPITDTQYENVEALMNEFCRVPFLAEFSRPVSLLHPELMTLYSKIVHHPMDLGHVCRTIRRREYKNLRAIQLDMWRIFSNCVKFHTHPSNRDNAIPSFISIANHLRDFFNNLWQEFMMSSDAPPRKPGKGISHVHSSYQKRAEARKERMVPISSTVLSAKCMRKVADALENFILTGGKVDNCDKDCVLGDINTAAGDVAIFIQSLRELIGLLEDRIESGQEYTVGSLHRDLKKTFTDDVFANEVLKRMRIGSRLDRLFWKILVPVHEVNSRGVNQSSIWGNMAAVIWARESKKKAFWPAIVLGMIPPDFQKEDWHEALTSQNEGRLPEKLREELKLGKRRAEQALKKQTSEPMSYFLVEFMGSHEFIWVRESDIVETFDPEVDPNVASAAGNVTKKKRSGHSSINPKLMSDAIEEGRWALEEFEILISDPCGDASSDDAEEESEDYEGGYTYDVMCQSDDEADEMEAADKRKANDSDVEELNELLANNGCLDYSVEGRKKAKAKAAELKKHKAALAKQEKSKEAKAKKDAAAKKKPTVAANDIKQLAKQLEEEEKRVEARRKKRARDHEKALKDLEKQAKKSKGTPDKRPNPHHIPDKKARAETFVKSFLIHKHKALSDFHGPPFIPTNDPPELLCMSLAFRAAAGDVIFQDNKGKKFIESPWDKIDATVPKESLQRCQLLQEQIELIEKELQKVNDATIRRRALYDKAKHSRDATHQRFIDAGEKVKSTKKVFQSSSKKKKKSVGKIEPIKSSEDDGMNGQTPDGKLSVAPAVTAINEKPSKVESHSSELKNDRSNELTSTIETTNCDASKIEKIAIGTASSTPEVISNSFKTEGPSDTVIKMETSEAEIEKEPTSAMEVDVP